VFEVAHCYFCLGALKQLNHERLLLLSNVETSKPWRDYCCLSTLKRPNLERITVNAETADLRTEAYLSVLYLTCINIFPSVSAWNSCITPCRLHDGCFTSDQHRKEAFPTRPPQNWMIFCYEILVAMQISFPAKFFCFMTTVILRGDVHICKREPRFFLGGGGRSCLRKCDVTCAVIETRTSFYAHFKANKMLLAFVEVFK
jgi:hypothetical protein